MKATIFRKMIYFSLKEKNTEDILVAEYKNRLLQFWYILAEMCTCKRKQKMLLEFVLFGRKV